MTFTASPPREVSLVLVLHVAAGLAHGLDDLDQEQAAASGYNRRGSKDSQLR
ncbi:MAG: hypothetical protein M0Q42_10175 [Xanthomonadales bacterium]|nr:hypothetical protein [Xanthomonadales bacterium]